MVRGLWCAGKSLLRAGEFLQIFPARSNTAFNRGVELSRFGDFPHRVGSVENSIWARVSCSAMMHCACIGA